MTVGVVIPCFNEALRLGEVLDALARQTQQPDETVVVDDGSTDDTMAVAERWRDDHPESNVRVVAGARRGIAAAVATGVAALSTDVVIRLDGHCRPATDYLAHVTALVRADDVGVAGGVWMIEPGEVSAEAEAIAIAMAHPLGSGGASYRDTSLGEPRDVDTVPFGCFRRSLWFELGGLSEDLRANEDYEFNYRVRQRGLRVVLDPRVRCVYYARSRLGDVVRQYGRYGWWKARMLLRHPRSIRWRQLIPALLVPSLLLLSFAAFVDNWRVWGALLALYPLAIVGGAIHAAIGRDRLAVTGWLAGAFVTIQLAWSTAFWLSLVSAALPRPRTTA